ncbi:MAG TPA: methyltransferase domain-containing protein, partial [Mycobacteriales bacterium]|nr:methyltransferase domain-containing protein [Mycobacteriales bacterium]
MADPPVRPLNDPQQYDDLAEAWWDPRGRFAMLHWISAARAHLVPLATHPGSLLLDLACGAGLLAPHVARHGHRHVGLDLSQAALVQARAHGVAPVRGDVTRLPFADEVADVVVAGEILEHVPDPAALVVEACRVLRPGGTLVVDTIAATWWGRFSAVTAAERLPGGPPPRLHDPALFVDREQLLRAARGGGVELGLTGLRPSARDYLGWLAGRREGVRMRTTRSTAGLFQGVGRKTRTSPRTSP